MKVLITSSRLPFALGMVRQLAAAGHEVHAADDYERAPGSHSKYLAGSYVYPSPRERTDEFIAELARIAEEAEIEVIVPAFEEAFFIAARAGALPERTTVFTGAFGPLARLHDKVAFQRLVTELGLPVPESVVATSPGSTTPATAGMTRSRRSIRPSRPRTSATAASASTRSSSSRWPAT